MKFFTKCDLPISFGLILFLVSIWTQPTPSNGWPTNFFRGSRIGYGRNIRPIHCVEKRKNIGGICMFAWDCMKANGTHLGTCIDRFYFGSCCQIKAMPRPPPATQDVDLETNLLEEVSPVDSESLGFGDYAMEEEMEAKPSPVPDINMSNKHPETQGSTLDSEVTLPETGEESDPSVDTPEGESSSSANEIEISSNNLSPSINEEPGGGIKPSLEGSEPQLEDSEPAVESAEPEFEGSEPVVEGAKPEFEGSDSVVEESESVLESSEPEFEGSEPVLEGSEAGPEDSEPSSDLETQFSDSRPDSESNLNFVPVDESASEVDLVPESDSSIIDSDSNSESGSDSASDQESSVLDSEVIADTEVSPDSTTDKEAITNSATDINPSSAIETEVIPDSSTDTETSSDSVTDTESVSDSFYEPSTDSDSVSYFDTSSANTSDATVESDSSSSISDMDATIDTKTEADIIDGPVTDMETPTHADIFSDLPTTTESIFFGDDVPVKTETSSGGSMGPGSSIFGSDMDSDYDSMPFGIEVITPSDENNLETENVTEVEDTLVTESSNVLLLDDTSVTEESVQSSSTSSSDTSSEVHTESILPETSEDEMEVLETSTKYYSFLSETDTSASSSITTEISLPEEGIVLPSSTDGDSSVVAESSTVTEGEMETVKESSSEAPQIQEADATTPDVIKVIESTTSEEIEAPFEPTEPPQKIDVTTEIENSWNEVEIIDNVPSSASPSDSNTESSVESAKISIAFPDEGITSESPLANLSVTSVPDSSLVNSSVTSIPDTSLVNSSVTSVPLEFNTSVTSQPVEAMSPAEQETLLVQMLKIANYKDVCGKPVYPISRIVGGLEASYGEWPWQVSLRQWRSVAFLHKCGSALVNENWAITAAHCVEGIEPDQLLLVMGEFDLGTTKEPYGHVERSVQVIAMHPKFEPRTFEYDLALLRFSEPISFQPNIIPICIPEDDYNFLNDTGFVTGWGRLYEDGPLPTVMQKVPVPVIPNKDCEGMYKEAGYIEHIPNIFICAGYQAGKQDSCEGDSGGPMVINHKDRWRLAGIISWGIGCAVPNQPGVYTRISEFREWINKIIRF